MCRVLKGRIRMKKFFFFSSFFLIDQEVVKHSFASIILQGLAFGN